MSDLTTELQEYSRFLVDAVEPVTFEEIVWLAEGGASSAEPSGSELGALPLPGVSADARTKTRGRAIALIAVAVALLGVSIGLLLSTGGDPESIEVNPSDSEATTTDSSLATRTVPRSVEAAAALPPEGELPSTPENSELLAAIVFSRFVDFPGAEQWKGTSINVYADGRVLWVPADGFPGGVAQSRLSSEGVDRARSKFLSAGLFDAGRTPSELGVWDACACIIRVRDGGRLRSTALPPADDPSQADPQVEREVDRLVEYTTTLWSALPPSAWEDHELTAYVPSRYWVCAWDEGIPASHSVPDLSNVLARLLGPPLAQMLDEHGWAHSSWEDCVELTLADARVLVDGLNDAGVRYTTPLPVYRTLVPTPDSSQDLYLSVGLQPLMPDGEPPLLAPG